MFMMYQAIRQIQRIVFTFNYVNPKLLLIASAWAESLGNRPIEGGKSHSGFIIPGVIPGLPEIRLVDMNRITHELQSLLLDIVEKHRAFDAASDYRALANYPMFLAKSWEGLKPYVSSDDYLLFGADLKQRSIELVHDQMPFPVTLNTDYLYQFYNPGEMAGIMGVVSMFQNILPDLIIEGEFFRRMIC